MADQSNTLSLAIVRIDLIHELVGVANRGQVICENELFFIQIELLGQNFRRLRRSKVWAA
jgi:hypothetical protein